MRHSIRKKKGYTSIINISAKLITQTKHCFTSVNKYYNIKQYFKIKENSISIYILNYQISSLY